MASATTLLGKAIANIRGAGAILQLSNGDEDQLNLAAYHLQQAEELALKYVLERNGIEYPKTHDIDQLIQVANTNDVDLLLNEYLEDHSEMFSQWEAKSRYALGYSIEYKKIEKALKEIDAHLARIAESENPK